MQPFQALCVEKYARMRNICYAWVTDQPMKVVLYCLICCLFWRNTKHNETSQLILSDIIFRRFLQLPACQKRAALNIRKSASAEVDVSQQRTVTKQFWEGSAAMGFPPAQIKNPHVCVGHKHTGTISMQFTWTRTVVCVDLTLGRCVFLLEMRLCVACGRQLLSPLPGTESDRHWII